MDKGQLIALDRKFPYVIELPRHPDHPVNQKNGDPRKAWLYSGVASGKWMVDDEPSFGGHFFSSGMRTYRFQHEYDAIMFKLKWV